jgi:hypothetical protein
MDFCTKKISLVVLVSQMQRLVLFFGVQLTIIIIAIVAYTGLFDPSSRAARIISSPPANPVNSPEAVKPVQPISPLQIFFKDLLATLSKNWFLFLIPAIVFLTVFFLKEITARRKAQRVDNDNGSSKPDQSQNNDQSTKRQSAIISQEFLDQLADDADNADEAFKKAEQEYTDTKQAFDNREAELELAKKKGGDTKQLESDIKDLKTKLDKTDQAARQALDRLEEAKQAVSNAYKKRVGQSTTSLQSNQSRNSDDYTEISSIPDVRSRSRSFWDTLLDETVAETNRVTGRFARGREERQSGGWTNPMYRSEKRRNSFS